MFEKEINVAVNDSKLEKDNDPDTIEWVDQQNNLTLKHFGKCSNFEQLVDHCRKIVREDRSREPIPARAEDGKFYRTYCSTGEGMGILQRTSLEELKSEEPKWEQLLDLDDLHQKEGIRWILNSYHLELNSDRALMSFSKEGSDGCEIREYDFSKKEFVKDGFYLPQGENDAGWINSDKVIFKSNHAHAKAKTVSFPKEVNIWKRGEGIDQSETIFRVNGEDEEVDFFYQEGRDREYLIITTRDLTHRQKYYYVPDLASPKVNIPLFLPEHTHPKGFINNKLIVMMGSPWCSGGYCFPIFSILAIELPTSNYGHLNVTQLFAPSTGYVKDVAVLSDKILVLERKVNKFNIWEISYGSGSFKKVRLDYPEEGSASIVANGGESSYLVFYSHFLSPTEIYLHRNDRPPKLLHSDPDMFDHSKFEYLNYNTTSFDGEQIPYTVVKAKDLPLDGKNRCLLTAYGGFNIASDPHYVGHIGTELLMKGYVYVIAYIRGGGEFGPEWHAKAVLENKPVSYQDFFAVMKDLHRRKITSPEYLSIKGGSNGGLLVGVAVTQAPHLFASAVGEHGLYDMLRYHLSGKGRLWMTEYGDPSDYGMKQVLESYSPVHNVDETPQPVFLLTSSSNDDRVDPSHSRKMAHKSQSFGHLTFLYQRQGGGHFGHLDIEAEAVIRALRLTFYDQTLASRENGPAKVVDPAKQNKDQSSLNNSWSPSTNQSHHFGQTTSQPVLNEWSSSSSSTNTFSNNNLFDNSYSLSSQFNSDQFNSNQFNSNQFNSNQFNSNQFNSNQFNSNQLNNFNSNQFYSSNGLNGLDWSNNGFSNLYL